MFLVSCMYNARTAQIKHVEKVIEIYTELDAVVRKRNCGEEGVTWCFDGGAYFGGNDAVTIGMVHGFFVELRAADDEGTMSD